MMAWPFDLLPTTSVKTVEEATAQAKQYATYSLMAQGLQILLLTFILFTLASDKKG